MKYLRGIKKASRVTFHNGLTHNEMKVIIVAAIALITLFLISLVDDVLIIGPLSIILGIPIAYTFIFFTIVFFITVAFAYRKFIR